MCIHDKLDLIAEHITHFMARYLIGIFIVIYRCSFKNNPKSKLLNFSCFAVRQHSVEQYSIVLTTRTYLSTERIGGYKALRQIPKLHLSSHGKVRRSADNTCETIALPPALPGLSVVTSASYLLCPSLRRLYLKPPACPSKRPTVPSYRTSLSHIWKLERSIFHPQSDD